MSHTRSPRPGEPTPVGEPKRYLSGRGYVRLRWLVSPETYIEVYEHRLVMGNPPGVEIHHLNGVKTDNRPENLLALSKIEHAELHARTTPQKYKGKLRQPLSEYPRCEAGCGRPAQCRNRTLCLMHYKRVKKLET